MAVCFTALRFEAKAFNWIVAMATIGFTFTLNYTRVCAFKILQWASAEYHEHVEVSASTTRKLFTGAGVLPSLPLTVLLLAQGPPGQLTIPSLWPWKCGCSSGRSSALRATAKVNPCLSKTSLSPS